MRHCDSFFLFLLYFCVREEKRSGNDGERRFEAWKIVTSLPPFPECIYRKKYEFFCRTIHRGIIFGPINSGDEKCDTLCAFRIFPNMAGCIHFSPSFLHSSKVKRRRRDKFNNEGNKKCMSPPSSFFSRNCAEKIKGKPCEKKEVAPYVWRMPTLLHVFHSTRTSSSPNKNEAEARKKLQIHLTLVGGVMSVEFAAAWK